MFYAVLFTIMLVIALACILPAIWVILSSFQSPKQFYSLRPSLIPRDLHWSKLGEVWNVLDFNILYRNSIILTLGSVVFSILSSSLLAFVLSRLKPRGTKFIYIVILWTLMIPNTTVMISVYQNIIHFPLIGGNLLNSFWPLWLMSGANAFYVIVFKSFFDGIPKDLIEAAQIDGSSSVGIFFRVIAPMSIPVIMTISIFTMIGSWSDFFWPYLVLQKKSMQTVMVAIFSSTGLAADQKLIALTLAMLPPIVLFIFLQKYIMKGLSFTGVKG